MEIACPYCGTKLMASEAHLGKKVRCSKCKHILLVEEPHKQRRPREIEQVADISPEVSRNERIPEKDWLDRFIHAEPVQNRPLTTRHPAGIHRKASRTNQICPATKAYDVRELYTFIVQQLKGNPYIPINPRNQKDDKTFGPHGCPICQGGLEMKSTGRWTEGNRDRLKFRCPLKTAKKKTAAQKQVCPASHPSFDTGKCYGCTKYLDVTDDARARVPRDSKQFKKTFRNRQFVEQYFARLGDREVEQTTHYALKTVRNQMTIAHLTASLIGVAAAILLKQPEKMRCHKRFAQLPTQRMTA